MVLDISEHTDKLELLRHAKSVDMVYAGVMGEVDNPFRQARIAYLGKLCDFKPNEEGFASWLSNISLEKEWLSKHRYRNHILLAAGLIKPLTALDWSVDRTREADKKMGIKAGGLSVLQNLVATHIGGAKHTHLHKGPGDGKYMTELRKKNAQWTQKGIADRYYVTIESILEKKLSEKAKGDIFFQNAIKPVFYKAIRRALQKKWYKGEKGNREATMTTAFCNPNDINQLTSDDIQIALAELIKDDFFLSKAIMFEDDGKELMECRIYAWILKMIGGDLGYIIRELRDGGRRSIIQKSIQEIRTKKGNLLHITARIKKMRDPENPRNRGYIEARKEEILRTYGADEANNIGDKDKLMEWIRQKINSFNREEETLKSANRDLTQIFSPAKIDFLNEDYGLKDFLGEYFSGEIFTLARNSGVGEADLTTDLEVSQIQDTQIGYFTEIPDLFEKNSIALISATRSDSHENDEQFRRDIKGCIDVLKPGGIIITDGCYASYTDIQRYDIIEDIVRGRTDLQVRVIVDKISHRPRSILIQKGAPREKENEGYNFLEERSLNNVLETNHKFINLEEILQDPILRVRNIVFRRLLSLAKDNKGVFAPIRNDLLRVSDVAIRHTGREILRNAQFIPGVKIQFNNGGDGETYQKCCELAQAITADQKKQLKEMLERYAKGGDLGNVEEVLTDEEDSALLRQNPGFFYEICTDSRGFSDIPEGEREKYFSEKNAGIFKRSLSLSEAEEILQILDTMLRVADSGTLDQLEGFLSCELDGNKRRNFVYPLFDTHRGESLHRTAEYMYWLELRKDFFLDHIQRGRKKRKDGSIKKPPQGFEQEKLMERFFAINKDSREILEIRAFKSSGHVDTKGVVESTCTYVARLLTNARRKNTLPLLPPFIDHLLAPLISGERHTFPIIGKGEASTNKHFRSDSCPDNNHIVDSLGENRSSLRENFRKIESKNPKPVLFISFDNCSSNTNLKQQLQSLTERDDQIEQININPENPQFEENMENIRTWAQKGGLIVVGGSHEDAFGKFGQDFSNKIMRRIKEIVDSNKEVGIFATCFGYQTWVQGSNLGKTQRGMLEIGPYGIESNHGAMKGFETCSVVLSHTGHVILNDNITEHGYKVLGINTLTGQPVGIIGERGIMTQFHTDIPLDASGIKTFINGIPGWDGLRKIYGIGPTRAEGLFNSVRSADGGFVPPKDIGTQLLAQMLKTITGKIVH